MARYMAARVPPPLPPPREQVALQALARVGVRCLPARRNVNIALDLSLIVLIVVSFSTGWVASLLGLTEFGLHKYSSIALMAVATAHLGLHWRGLTAQLRRFGPRQSGPALRVVGGHGSRGPRPERSGTPTHQPRALEQPIELAPAASRPTQTIDEASGQRRAPLLARMRAFYRQPSVG